MISIIVCINGQPKWSEVDKLNVIMTNCCLSLYFLTTCMHLDLNFFLNRGEMVCASCEKKIKTFRFHLSKKSRTLVMMDFS